MYIYINIILYVYIYIEREREREMFPKLLNKQTCMTDTRSCLLQMFVVCDVTGPLFAFIDMSHTGPSVHPLEVGPQNIY